jgi:hydroxymethylglutaryl-CoA lyase
LPSFFNLSNLEEIYFMSLILTECPRDAMQGLHDFVPTELKIKFINAILACGFSRVDFGSFVSPKAIPQLRDTDQVLNKLVDSPSKLLAIIANERGANDAVQFDRIDFLGYPFSVSETFQMRNTNANIEDSLKRVESIQKICIEYNKKLVVYLSMAFGNPYGDQWHPDIVIKWGKTLSEMGIQHLSLADTIGVSSKENITYLFSALSKELQTIEIGMHLHSTEDKVQEKIDTAYKAGCRVFDMAIQGFGGCPMAEDKLTGNLNTNLVLNYLSNHSIESTISMQAFEKANIIATEIFAHYH